MPESPSGEFVNWSGSLRFTPGEFLHPADEEEVVERVRLAAERGETVRPVGSGHSSTPLSATDEVLMSLDRMSGLVAYDREALRGTLLPGTGLAEAGRLLAMADMGMENLGDVDYQAIAGAIATGTHGTGTTLPNLGANLVGGRLVTGTGAVVPFGEEAGPDHDPDLLRAARVSLGALGVMTSLTLRLLPDHDLHRVNWCTHIDWALEHFHRLAAAHRHFDLYWYPRSDLAQVRTLNMPGEEPEDPALIPPGRHLRRDETDSNHEIIPNSRELKFDEMEYMLPLEAGLECFRVIRERIRERHRRTVAWRVLLRTIAPDDGLISTCEGRPTMTIALLQNNTLPHDEYFGDLEPILRDFGGRPHWGKKHSLRAADLRPLYPGWDTFNEVRRRLDPKGVFLNDHLRDLLIEEGSEEWHRVGETRKRRREEARA
ncbi:FAD-binding protein [Streptomyces alkaliphilus]|uniref:FAD-binding protein n=1 Tax=Streptomyces alkaliphilus TaxID=1472722 RepID=A0A7W3Y1W4_9ACTN|nr:D-arabinono-1,4-lactone oxidase [Streptomyces alkaliphilus]MBB0245124.1 FAD-binding protein [Streptomyces alkaliphilus]